MNSETLLCNRAERGGAQLKLIIFVALLL